MKKIYILAAFLMATTSAQAGGISFQINGERVRIEAPSNCAAISCVKVISPGYTGTLGNVDLKGMGKKKSDDDDVVTSVPAAPAPAPAPVQAAAPRARRSRSCGCTRPCSDHRRGCDAVAIRNGDARAAAACAARSGRGCAGSGSGPGRRRVRSELADRHLDDGREQGQRAHRGMRRQSVRLFRQHRRTKS